MRPGRQRAQPAWRLRSLPWLGFVASLVGLLASVLPVQTLLAFTVDGMYAGEIWRFWTGHFVHYGEAHFWGDWLAFLVWAALVESESRKALLLSLLVGAPLLLLALELTCPTLGEYRGLSGIDTALVIELVLLRGFNRGKDGERGIGPWLTRVVGHSSLRVVGAASSCALLAKIGYEFDAGHALLAHDLGPGVTLVPEAHAFGALVGAGIGLICRRRMEELPL